MFPVSHLPESEISSLANEEVLTKDQDEPNVVSSRLIFQEAAPACTTRDSGNVDGRHSGLQ